MNAIDVLETLTAHAKMYRTDAEDSLRRNAHMNRLLVTDKLPQQVIDAVLVDFINFVGVKCGVDYALYTSDLEEKS